MLRFGASVGCEPVFSTVVFIAVETNAARYAFCDAPTILQKTTIVEPNLLWNSPFVNEARNRKQKKQPLALLRSALCRGFAFLHSLPCIKAM